MKQQTINMTPKKVSRIIFPKLKMIWEGKKAAAAAFKGQMDFEQWVINEQQAQDERFLNNFVKGSAPIEGVEEGWVGPEEFMGMMKEPLGPKEALLEQAHEIRRQLDEAIDNDEFEKCENLQKILDIIEIKYNKL